MFEKFKKIDQRIVKAGSVVLGAALFGVIAYLISGQLNDPAVPLFDPDAVDVTISE